MQLTVRLFYTGKKTFGGWPMVIWKVMITDGNRRRQKDMDKRMKVVLCGANAYNKKYFLNPDFLRLPDQVKKELNILCVMFTQQQSGTFSMGFDEDGKLLLSTEHEPGDVKYDEASCEEAVRQIQEDKSELIWQLTLFYNVLMLGKSLEDIRI
jgi:hypothetical protein